MKDTHHRFINDKSISKNRFFYRSESGTPEIGKKADLDVGDFTQLKLKEFANGITFSGTEEKFFSDYNLIDPSHNKLSTGEALLGLSVFDQDGIANIKVTSIDEKTVGDYLGVAVKNFGFGSDDYKNSLQYLFSAIKGITDTQAEKLAEKLKYFNKSNIMGVLFDTSNITGTINASESDEKLNETVLNSALDYCNIEN